MYDMYSEENNINLFNYNTIQYISINDFMYNMYDVNIQQCKEFYKIK